MVDGPNLYAYTRNNPVNWRDPSGRLLACGGDGGGGGGTGGGIQGSGGGVSASAYIRPEYSAEVDWGAWANKCWFNWVLFGAGLVASLVGVQLSSRLSDPILRYMGRGASIGTAWALGIASIGNGFYSGNVLGALAGISRLAISYGWTIFTDIILPELGFWGGLWASANAAATLIPGVIAAKLAVLIGSIGLGLYGLATAGCLIPPA